MMHLIFYIAFRYPPIMSSLKFHQHFAIKYFQIRQKIATTPYDSEQGLKCISSYQYFSLASSLRHISCTDCSSTMYILSISVNKSNKIKRRIRYPQSETRPIHEDDQLIEVSKKRDRETHREVRSCSSSHFPMNGRLLKGRRE